MAQVINTNSLSLLTQNNLNKSQSALAPLSSVCLLVCVSTARKTMRQVRRLLTVLPRTSKV
ncbi:flagellin [Salmonella enterica subsp. enterica]|uniref:Flagellin n=1 Tax=Salmonella enterica I TaxID=59201 RepID=A0A379VM43_SALET|nr:flagellin [Salmonella enterica subsp. enterica]